MKERAASENAQGRTARRPGKAPSEELRRLREENAALLERLSVMTIGAIEAQRSRRAALNLMEEALEARRLSDQLNTNLKLEIGERRRVEEALRRAADRDGFRARISDALRPLNDPALMQAEAARLLGEYLDASRSHYALIDGEHAVVERDFNRGMSPVVGRHVLKDYPFLMAECRAGRTCVVVDVRSDVRLGLEERNSLTALSISALVLVPLVKEGEFVALMAIHQEEARGWATTEIALIEETAERIWAAVERARVEKTLRKSEEKYRTLFETIDEGFCLVEVLFDELGVACDYRFLEVNPAFENHTGLKNAAGRSMRELQPDYDVQGFEIYGRVLRTGKAERFEQTVPALGRHFDVYASRVGTEEQRQVAIIFSDITERRLASDALAESRVVLEETLQENKKARAEAEAAGRAKDHFLAILSHELRTPLSPVLMSAIGLLRRNDLGPAAIKGLQMILRNVELECQLIDDLLDLTRIARGKLVITSEPLDLHEIIRSAIEVSRPDLEKRRQTLSVDLMAGRTMLSGDTTRLQQTIWNLLKNASKFTPAAGVIGISTGNRDDRIEVIVTDSGAGIEPENLAVIFDAFNQGEEDVAQKHGGLGLGLAIAKATVEAHGGSIRAHSEGKGHGSTFVIELPLA